MAASAVDHDISPSTASAIAKYHMTEISRLIINHAMDVHAGHGIQTGPRNFLANLHISTPISIAVEGANILTRNLIIFGQGAIRCHPYLLNEIEIISSASPDINALDTALMAHIGFYTSTLLRNLGYGLTGGRLIISKAKNRKIKKYMPQLTRMSAALALLADTSLILLGGSLKRRERISARLGDIMSQLYLASSVLKYYFDNDQQAVDLDYVSWCTEQCLFQIQNACNELFDNYPNRFVGKVLNWIIFPFGNAYTKPSDQLYHDIVIPMLTTSELRERLTRFCFRSKQHDDIGRRLDVALDIAPAVDPLWKKMQAAVHKGQIPRGQSIEERIRLARTAGILTAEEASSLGEFESLRSEIIKVNEFSFTFDNVIA
jgi:hypothetical protein